MKEYQVSNTIYIDIKDIKAECKDYCKGTRSYTQLLQKKNITNYVYGQLVDDQLNITDKYSKKLGSIFINKDDLKELFDNLKLPKETLLPAPPLIEDKDLIFFKDDEGKEYSVPMRGERTKEGIYFQVKGVMSVFDMPSLQNNILKPHTIFAINDHYIYFNAKEKYSVLSQHVKEMYLTYSGLMHVINASKSGISHKFKNWIDEIVFSAAWGTENQKIETFKKVLNVDAEHLKHIMNKSGISISCLYLIDIGENNEGKRVFKFGFTDNVSRRFKQHMRNYGDSIKLDTFVLIPAFDLSKAEADFKNSVSRYRYVKEGDDELISLCDEAYLNIKTIFRTISDKYCGNMKQQIAIYENQIRDLTHAYELQLRDKDTEIIQLQGQLQLKDAEISIKEKDNEILQLKLQLLQQSITTK